MDKETFSSYGWIIVTVIVVALMIAFATPFGNYIIGQVTEAVKTFAGVATNATTGLANAVKDNVASGVVAIS